MRRRVRRLMAMAGVFQRITSMLPRQCAFDFWFTEAGITLNSYGVEGTDYTIVNGVKEYTQQAKDYAGGVPELYGYVWQPRNRIPVSLEAEIKE